jgi:tetratricopeptide (TPR) repeat protein
MKKSIILISILFVTSSSFAQTYEEASNLFALKKYDSAWTVTKNLMEQKNSNIEVWALAGRIETARGNFREAPAYFEKALKRSSLKPYAAAWSMADLGQCYFFMNNYKKAKQNLTSCIKMNATINATNAAKYSLLLMGMDELYESWITRESTHFTFHFQDTTAVGDVNAYIKSKESAFEEINSFLQATMPRKIDYFVWRDETAGMSVLGRALAFTEPSLCLTHTAPKHTVGHEMTHSISYYASKPVMRNRLISEGVCVYFSTSMKDNAELLKNQSVSSIADIWKRGGKGKDELIYPLGGELVGKLIKDFGRDKFMKLLANQSYESAKKIYGADLDSVLEQMELDNSR